MERERVGTEPGLDGGSRRGKGTAGGADDARSIEIRRRLIEFGLSDTEARVLLALMHLGRATATEISVRAEIQRTSVYQVIEELASKHLVRQLPGKVASWSSLTVDDALRRLMTAQEERITGLRSGIDEVRKLVLGSLAEPPRPAVPQIDIIPTPAEVTQIYERLLGQAEVELVAFVKPPLARRPASSVEPVWPVWQEALRRGVSIRTVYEEGSFRHPNPWLDAAVIAGEQARVVDTVPLKLSVFDRRVALLALTDSTASDSDFPTTMLVEHAGLAALLASTVQMSWEAGRPHQPEAHPA